MANRHHCREDLRPLRPIPGACPSRVHHKGYAEVDHDYTARIAMAQEEDMRLWEEVNKRETWKASRSPTATTPFYADFYDPFDPEEEAVDQAAVGE
jgi:hypothetical protein